MMIGARVCRLIVHGSGGALKTTMPDGTSSRKRVSLVTILVTRRSRRCTPETTYLTRKHQVVSLVGLPMKLLHVQTITEALAKRSIFASTWYPVSVKPTSHMRRILYFTSLWRTFLASSAAKNKRMSV